MKSTARLRRLILSRQAIVTVVGQGYVGLTVACGAASEGFHVTGLDRDERRLADLRDGILSVPGVPEGTFRAGRESSHLVFTSDPESIRQAHIVIVAVPTPLKDHAPDMSFVESACRDIAAHLTPGQLVIVESTVYPGTTDEFVRPLLETSGLRSQLDFLLAFSPERIDPGNAEFDLRNTPRIVGGLGPEACAISALFYEQLVDKVAVLSSARSAELAKLLENTFRHVNIALVNELAMLCHEMGIDVWEVIEAAATKPFGFMAFRPGPGVGGHCIPLDPGYLAWQVRRDAGRPFRILEQAQEINAMMPAHVAARIGDLLNERGQTVKRAAIFALGVAYKEGVGDVRESPAVRVLAALHRRGAEVAFHDPFIESITINGKVVQRSNLTRRAVESADCVPLLTPHPQYDLDWIADHAGVVFDARDAYGSARRPNVVRL